MTETVELEVPKAAALPYEKVFGIVLGFFQSRAMVVATELELADYLANGPLEIETLAERTHTHAPSLFRLMRALASIGIFKQEPSGAFANTPASECLRKNDPGALWGWIQMMQSVGGGQYEAWAGLTDNIRTGKTAFDALYGYSHWEFLSRNPGVIFNDGMRSATKSMAPAVSASYDWGRFPVIADIGGGIGPQLVDILNTYRSCRGILFDRPEVIANAISHDRMEHVAGDFFKSVPAGADAYILRGVIHDWNDADSVAILRQVRHAMKPGSRSMIIEYLIPETNEFAPSKWLDLNMMVVSGGRERTVSEYRDLYVKAGLEVEQVVPTRAVMSIVVGRRRD